TLLLVSHDRSFLNHVVTSTLVFEKPGVVNEYVGGYDDWLRQRSEDESQDDKKSSKSLVAEPKQESETAPKRKKLSYNDQRELDLLPKKIEALENEQDELHAQMAEPEFYSQENAKIAKVQERLAEVISELEQCYRRWEILEG
ncbi:MAG: ABC transporter ATP-binding protein, partial [Gammaproteobacteria bacterium]|nr:ABC transporter ATP-binding protein [Gammaproteobacteria bacterium]